MLVLREKCKKLFIGDATFKKVELWLMAAICILLGVVIGFIKAPLTHGVTISCGNNNGNVYGQDKEEQDSEEEEK